MTKNKYPKGMHFYVLKDEGMYKIGYTKDLTKRLATYNTGNANKASYTYYKKTDCAKEIEECMKALLNEYIYFLNNCEWSTLSFFDVLSAKEIDTISDNNIRMCFYSLYGHLEFYKWVYQNIKRKNEII